MSVIFRTKFIFYPQINFNAFQLCTRCIEGMWRKPMMNDVLKASKLLMIQKKKKIQVLKNLLNHVEYEKCHEDDT